MKEDTSILVHIQDKDCVSLEVRYHKSCYRQYTRFLSKTTPTITGTPEEQNEPTYDACYNIFCEKVIRQRIIVNQEILTMTHLRRIFINLVKDHEKLDASNYRQDKLKRRLARDFPQLVFYSPSKRNMCQMVFVEMLSADTLIDRLPHPLATGTTTESTEVSQTESDCEKNPNTTVGQERSSTGVSVNTLEDTRTLYSAALILKKLLRDSSGMTCPWPPTSDDLNVTEAKSVVPLELYNLISWIVGAAEEPTLACYVDIPDDMNLKMISICQDILYLASKGRRQTPKSLCLGLTVRHLTGSSHIVSLLNRLGHCASWDTVVSLDTSLAQLQLVEGRDKIPKGFSKKTPTVLVWDNIDFGEETLSGHGTTHHTNGIMLQSSVVEPVPATNRQPLQKGVSTLKPPPSIPVEHYHQFKRQGPQNLFHHEMIPLEAEAYRLNTVSAAKTELAYVFLKCVDAGKCTIPSWTGFHTLLQGDGTLQKSALYYLPVIEASPTEMSTVNTILKRSVQIADQLELDHIVLVFDQAIYAKAQQIRWKDDSLTRRLVIRLGEFHTCMSYLGILGKRFGDAGLVDILIESEIVATGSINGVISGHHYNRSMRAHKLLYESLQRIRFNAFLDSLPPKEKNECMDVINQIKCAFPNRTIDVLCENVKLDQMCSKYEDFVTRQNAESPTFAFWSSYIDMVQILLLFVSATRESDWQLHLSTLRLMMAWFFAYDRVNYARYLPSYWLEMVSLPLTHPSCHSDLCVKGQWTVQRQNVHGFASIACDQAIEQTCNRDSKTKGGWIGMTQNRAAVYRWILSQHERAAIARQCESMAGKSPEIRKRKDLDTTRIHADEKAVTRIISTLDSMLNPFDTHRDGIVCLSSGAVATEEVQKDLLAAPEIGETAFNEFISQRLLTPSVDIFAPIKAQKLKTFSDQAKTKKRPAASKDVILCADKKLFSRLLIIGQSRKTDLREILSYSLGIVSYPLASSDGSLAKTNKSALLDLLETKGGDCLVEKVPANGAILFDGMAVIQAIRSVPSTFGELGETILQYMIKLALKHKCTRIDFVIDRYPEICIKNLERSHRAGGGTQQVHIFGRDQRTPTQWKKFLSDGTNKEALAEFLFEVWQGADLTKVGKDLSLYIAHGELCHCVTATNGVQTLSAVVDLTCDHEECDTRLFLHAQHAAQEHQTVVIKSPDTDVAVIAITLQRALRCSLYFFTGVNNRTRIIDIAKVSSALDTSVCSALIGIHTFSGCDSTSAFQGKGKRKTFSVASEKEEYLTAFTNLGSSFNLDQSTFEVLCKYVCHLYGQTSAKNVNDARYKAFCMSSSALPELSMPPTSDALYQHCKRANYQAAVMRHSLKSKICAPSPIGNGWHLENGELAVTWMTKLPAPESVLQVVHCSCKQGKCETGRCSCMSARLCCTDLCKCQNCENVSKETEQNATWADNSDESDVDE
ncbi:uncharacterized protein LOC111197609 isoform X2 [Astyanax mexicanus]|uniref:uncharacterized protein LOC111197609 isoform X2 n=1 Tax=Astyanax mexicanus TaxID=7994 RepID=UPI0020CAE782|nr:uncharacterized protein LOC111197609 isoform X2 [Astyanax mexicanus]XP_049332865.1 uncharacterized protein LOC111197609 isoform X2 [Astyanax mexicanus]XP_049332866.1 uncharacterized protein LOC111197609 isoform X2 [Astyanax mexicanus]XP_049332867.1 uncharacterized protein LOC111197609 isoform X2 [Astyanax mexicanus]